MWYNKYKMKKYLKLGIVCGVAVFGIAAFITGITFGILHFNNSNGRGGFDSQVSNPIEEEIAADASIFNFSEENLSQDDSELSYISYRVKKGDMIGFIADEFGITQDTIISVNNIHSSRLIQIGQAGLPELLQPGIGLPIRLDHVGEIDDLFQLGLAGTPCRVIQDRSDHMLIPHSIILHGEKAPDLCM